MAALAPGLREIHQGDRLYQPLTSLMISMQAVIYALTALRGRRPQFEPDEAQEVRSDAAPIRILFPLSGPLEMAILGKASPDYFTIKIELLPQSLTPHDINVELPQLIMNLVAPIYALHFHSCHEWMDNNQRSDTQTWPEALDFGRCARNAIAHGGRLRFKSRNYRRVWWGKLAYSGADHDRVIIDRDIYFGDLVALMLSNDDELVALGAPR
jgi:hypothetical protein